MCRLEVPGVAIVRGCRKYGESKISRGPLHILTIIKEEGFHDSIECGWVGLPLVKKCQKLGSVGESSLQKSAHQSGDPTEVETSARFR